jgi:hypothetical protein
MRSKNPESRLDVSQEDDISGDSSDDSSLTSISLGFGVNVVEPQESKQASTPSQENLPPILSSQAVIDANLTKEQFKTVLDLKHGSLELRRGEDSALEWCLIYKNVEPEKMQEKVKAFADELNERLAEMVAVLPYKTQMPNGWRLFLAQKCELPEVSKKQDVKVFSTTLIDDSFNRDRSEKTELNGEIRGSINEFLKERDQIWVNNHHVRLAIAAFRVFAGFPEELEALATKTDIGDLCEGKVILTDIQGCSCVCATSHKMGVIGVNRFPRGRPHEDVGVVGGFSR